MKRFKVFQAPINWASRLMAKDLDGAIEAELGKEAPNKFLGWGQKHAFRDAKIYETLKAGSSYRTCRPYFTLSRAQHLEYGQFRSLLQEQNEDFNGNQSFQGPVR